MTMISLSAYEQFFWVHSENESPQSGESYATEEEAISGLMDDIKFNGLHDPMVITETLERIVGRAQVEITFERE